MDALFLAAIFDWKTHARDWPASVSALPAYTKEVTERPDSSRLATYFDLFSALLWLFFDLERVKIPAYLELSSLKPRAGNSIKSFSRA